MKYEIYFYIYSILITLDPTIRSFTMEKEEYVLGTEKEELHRLGVQHQVWSSEARKGWEIAEFGAGQKILDLGCGPGFCSMELAYMAGENGRVTAVDMSKVYIDFLDAQAKMHGLNIKAVNASFDEMKFMDFEFDGVFSRWALAWIDNVEEILEKVVKAMSPGAVFVAHEYYDWTTFQTEPDLPGLKYAVAKAFESMTALNGYMNIGRKLPEYFENAGLEVISVRPMNKMAIADELTWQWPKTYFEIYLPKLVPAYLTQEELHAALTDLHDLEDIPGASILCPSMIEVVAAKV